MVSRAFRESTSASVHACQWVISTRSGKPLRCVLRRLQELHVYESYMQSRTVRLLHDMPILLNLLQGMKWFLLADEEVPSMIMAITGRRGRPPNPDKEPRARGRRVRGAQGRRPGRPPKAKMEDLLSKVDARLLKRLEAKGESEYSQFENLLQCFPQNFEKLVGGPRSLFELLF